jgi:hypothetical protein
VRFHHAEFPPVLLSMPDIVKLIDIVGTRLVAAVLTKLVDLGEIGAKRSKTLRKQVNIITSHIAY